MEFLGITLPLNDLYQQIAEAGWHVTKVKYDRSSDRFIASAKHPNGAEQEAWGETEQYAVSNLLYKVTTATYGLMATSRTARWGTPFTSKLVEVAQAYADAPIYEKEAVQPFIELAKDSASRSEAIQEQLKIEFTHNPHPYKSPEDMFDDIRKKRKLTVSRIGREHPLWSPEDVMNYRIVHDVLGYCAANAGWDWEGENLAFAAHASIISEDAQKALFTESVGQTAYATYFRAYGTQKITVLKKVLEPIQDQENPHKGFRGHHPSQVAIPGEQPEAHKTSKARGVPRRLPDPNVDKDVNEGYKTLINPMPHVGSHPGAEYDPRKLLGIDELNGYADELQTNWHQYFKQMMKDNPAGLVKEEWELLKQTNPQEARSVEYAVINACRAAALSPQTRLDANAIHYQDVMNIPPDETDPNVYWDALNKARGEWNTKRFLRPREEGESDEDYELAKKNVETEHTGWLRVDSKDPLHGNITPILKLAYLFQDSMGMDPHEAQKTALREVYQMKTRFERYLKEENSKISAEIASLEKEGKSSEINWLVDNESNLMTIKWIHLVTEAGTNFDIYSPETTPATRAEFERRMNDPEYAQRVEEDEAWNTDKQIRQKHPEHFQPQSAKEKKPPPAKAFPDRGRAVRKQDKPFPHFVPEHSEQFADEPDLFNHSIDVQRYQAFSGQACQLMARLSAQRDELCVIALTDMQKGGQGYYWRMAMQRLNISGMGPKVISFSWLLLQPKTSELATIDTHMIKLLGYKATGKKNTKGKTLSMEDEFGGDERNYHRAERQLMAIRSALGLEDVPLGLIQWSLWDMGRTSKLPMRDLSFDPQKVQALFEEGKIDKDDYKKMMDRADKEEKLTPESSTIHQDHSPFSAHVPGKSSPKPWHKTRWLKPNPPLDDTTGNVISEDTKPFVSETEKHYDETIGQQGSASQMPYHGAEYPRDYSDPHYALDQQPTLSRVSSVPVVRHPQTGQELPGVEGQTIMGLLNQMGLSREDAWELPEELVGKHATMAA